MAIGGKNSSWKHATHGSPSSNNDYSTKTVSVTLNAEAETVESTTFGDAYRNYEQSFKNSTIDVQYKYDSAIYTVISDLFTNGTAVTFELGPNGATVSSGEPKISGSMFVTSFGTPVEIGNLLVLDVSFQVDGALTFGTY